MTKPSTVPSTVNNALLIPKLLTSSFVTTATAIQVLVSSNGLVDIMTATDPLQRL